MENAIFKVNTDCKDEHCPERGNCDGCGLVTEETELLLIDADGNSLPWKHSVITFTIKP